MANLQSITQRSEVGAIKPWGKATAPDGYLLCDGTAVSRTTYADLFGVLSTTYGVGNGSTTFNVPDLQGKTPQGYDGSTYNLAGTGGANTVTVAVTNNQAATNSVTNNQAVTVTGTIANTSLTTAQLASHSHTLTWGDGQMNNPSGIFLINGQASNQGHTASQFNSTQGVVSAGSGTGHNHTHTLAGTLTGTVAVTSTITGTVAAAGTTPWVELN